MKFLKQPVLDPEYNLALEEYLFDAFDDAEPLFWLWQNQPVVVIGRFQNATAEVNTVYAAEHGIGLVRRNTGGGAVYHDFGNVNFSIIFPAQEPENVDLKAMLMPVINALRAMDLPAELTGRNDITVNGKKISGCAFSQKDGKVLVHGTLLYDVDTDVMQRVLNVSRDKLENKGLDSVRSRVANIKEFVSGEPDIRCFIDDFLFYMNSSDENSEKYLNDDDVMKINLIKAKYSDVKWTFGRSPGYTIEKSKRYPFGGVSVYMNVGKGNIIENIKFSGDFFGSGTVEEFEKRLTGTELTLYSINDRLMSVDPKQYIAGMSAEELTDLLLS